MKLEARKYLYDIRMACDLLVEFTSGKALDDYEADILLRSAVERQFEIIGEAMNKLAGVDETTVRRITNHRRIIAFRNVLIHGYAEVDDRLVWNVIETNLAILRRDVNAVLDEGPDD